MKFGVGDVVKFHITGTHIIGEGEILSQPFSGICPMYVVLILKRETENMQKLPDRALLIQENFLWKKRD